jgi:kynureninase|tara:strand:- start:39 stop:266 length:228 start_codon:yes stop_codon:yes gene_type:complete
MVNSPSLYRAGWDIRHLLNSIRASFPLKALVSLTGTPPILSLMALDAALDVFADVDVKQLREKSMALTEYFLKLL